MKLILFLSLMTIVRAQEGPSPPLDEEQKKLIADLKVRALQYTKELPEFTCTEVIRKNEDSTGTSHHWKLVDTVHEEITYRGGKEEVKEVSNNGKEVSGRGHVNGLVTTADFAQAIQWVFDPKYEATFQWAKWDSLRGHRVHEIAYVVKPEKSELVVGKKQVKVGLLGVLDVDADTGTLLRIMTVATGLTKNSGVLAHSMEYNFDYAKIGDHYFLVPLKADIQSREGKVMSWNEFDFHDYRKP